MGLQFAAIALPVQVYAFTHRYPMEFIPITAAERDAINALQGGYRITNNECTFLAMYIWREVYHYEYAAYNGCLLVRSKYKDSPYAYRYPIGDGDRAAALDALRAHWATSRETPRLLGVTDEMLAELRTLCPNVQATPLRDYFDYVYDVAELSELAGKKYHAKRNHIAALERGGYEYSQIAPSDVDDCIAAYETWLRAHKLGDTHELQSEYRAIVDMLHNLDAWHIMSGMLRQNGRVIAFTMGEHLNDDTVVLHVEKADASVKGAYPCINRDFLRNACSAYTYVNREDDSGVEGLRKAKLSYNVHHFVEKYKVDFE